MIIKLSTDRVLDYTPRLDPRNLAHRVTAAPDLAGKSRYWTPGVVLDQQAEGSCVGHGVVGEWLASPVRGQLDLSGYVGPWSSGDKRADAGHKLAVDVYHRCLQIDEYEGERDEGTSVRAGMLVGRERGWWTGFKWALNMDELRTALEDGPVVVGIQVLERMWNTEPNGDWIPEGPEVGWHCVVLTGYSPNYYGRGPRYIGLNSWAYDWGKGGRFAIEPQRLDGILFKAGGEAAVALDRHL